MIDGVSSGVIRHVSLMLVLLYVPKAVGMRIENVLVSQQDDGLLLACCLGVLSEPAVRVGKKPPSETPACLHRPPFPNWIT